MKLDYYLRDKYGGSDHIVEDAKQCPFCGWWELEIFAQVCKCKHCFSTASMYNWNNRPIEDKLEEEISDLKYNIEQIHKILG